MMHSVLGLGVGDKAGLGKEELMTKADSFFGRPDLNQSGVQTRYANKCASGCLAIRAPEPPQFAPPTICSISKDGKIAAIGGPHTGLALWDTDTGDLLSTLKGSEVTWTTSHDCTFFVTVHEDSRVLLWDQQTLKQRQLLGHPDEALVCCSVSLDDMYVVSGGAKGTVYSWDSDNGAMSRVHYGGHTGPVQTVMCYPMSDGTHIIISCGAEDHKVCVHDLEAGTLRTSMVIEELSDAKHVRYHVSADGTQVLAWCTDSVPFPNLVFMDALTKTKNSVYCHNGLVRHAVFSRDSTNIISCGSDGNIVVWDADTLEATQTLHGHVGSVLCCGINDTGTRIVSSGEDCTIRLWSLDGKQLQIMEAQDAPVKLCAFAKNGTKILSCDVAGRVYVWTVLSEVILSLIRKFADSISSVCMSSDSKLLAAGCNNGRVMLWDASKRELVWEHSHHTGRVESVAFNGTKDTIATAGADGKVALIARDTGKQINCFNSVGEPVTTVIFSPDDERLAGVSAGGSLMLYLTATTSRTAKHTLRHDIALVNSCTWSPNSKLIAGCCSDGTVMVWEAASGGMYTVMEGENAATCCTFDGAGRLLAVGNVLGMTLIYNLETSEVLCELEGNASRVVDVCFSEDATRLTTVCSRQAIIWDVATGGRVRMFDFVLDKDGRFECSPHATRTTIAHDATVLFDHESEAIVYDMMSSDTVDAQMRSFFLSDTRVMSGGTAHRRIMVWSAAGSAAPDKFHTTHDAITSCHFGADDRLVAMGTQDGNIMLYDVVHGETVEVIAAHQNGPCRCVRLSADNKYILSSGADAKVILWDWKRRVATRIFAGHFNSVACCDMAQSGNRVVSGDDQGMICVFDKETGNAVQTLPLAHAKGVLSVSMSSDGSTIASVGDDGKVAIWDVDMGMDLVSLTAAIESKPLYCSFSPDGYKLAVTESDGHVMVWNALAGCQWYQVLNAHRGKVTSCSWSFDCRQLITAGSDSTMAVWDAECGAPLLRLNARAGALNTCWVSPQRIYVAVGSVTGTLAVMHLPTAQRSIPEPSFLYNWLATREPAQAAELYMHLAAQHSTLPNMQDARGWSLLSHTVAAGDAKVARLITSCLPDGCSSLGLTSAVPFTIQTRIEFHRQGEAHSGASFAEGEYDRPSFSRPSAAGRQMSVTVRTLGLPGGVAEATSTTRVVPLNVGPRGIGEGTELAQVTTQRPRPMAGAAQPESPHLPGSVREGNRREREGPFQHLRVGVAEAVERGMSFSAASAGRSKSFISPNTGGRKQRRASLLNIFGPERSSESMARSAKSFSNQNLLKVAVELFTVKREPDRMQLVRNNVVALSLNSKSSECVQVVLDAVVDEKVSWGSYHAVTDMMPSLLARYPYICYEFLTTLGLQQLGDLEVPVGIMQGLARSVIRTAPIYTNCKMLWQSHVKMQEEQADSDAYAHVKASMVRLPFACSVGRESLLRTLVDSTIPVMAYSSPTARAVITHKWRLYGRQHVVSRLLMQMLYASVFTCTAAFFAISEDHDTTLSEYWASGGTAKAHLIMDGYLVVQALYNSWVESHQLRAMGALSYFSYGWNVSDVLSIFIMLTIVPLHLARVSGEPGGALGPLIAIQMLLVYFKLLFYGLAFESTGPVIHMVFMITMAIRSWVLLLFLSIVGFGSALLVLYQRVTPTYLADYSNFGMMMLTMWQMVLGQFSLASLEDEGSWEAITIIIFSCFMFVTHIVLLNAVISLMYDTYSRVRETKEAEARFLQGRAQLICEVETLMTTDQLEAYALMPPYLHLLTPVQRQVHGGSNDTRLERVELLLQKLLLEKGNSTSAIHSFAPTGRIGMGGLGDGLERGLRGEGHMEGGGGNAMISVVNNVGGKGPRRSEVGGRSMGQEGPAMDAWGDARRTSTAAGAAAGGSSQAAVAAQLREASHLPAIMRQLDRLQRAVNLHDMRMEGVVSVLRDIENLLRNQQPITIQDGQPRNTRAAPVLSDVELEKQVQRLLGKTEQKL